MGNYIIEDEIEDYQAPKGSTVSKKNNQSKTIFIAGAVLILMLFIILVSGTRAKQTYFERLEEQMVEKTKDYVSLNASDLSNETYFDITKTGVKIPENCNILSGVFYKDGEYTPYLVCDNFTSNIAIDSSDTFELLGNKIVLLTKGSDYYELGHNSQSSVQISGRVDVNKEGVYNIYYIPRMGNTYAIRKVIVVDNPLANSQLPVMNIQDDYLEVGLGEDYSENVTAVDKIDGNITNKIVKFSNVDLNETGEYHNIYSVTNSLGYTSMLLQKIIVLNKEETTIIAHVDDDNMTNTSVNIIVKVIGERFDHLVLPNHREITDREYSYEVDENGEYRFVAVNDDNTEVLKVVKVNNIDTSVPSGSCTVVEYYNKAVFSVSINSFNHIVGYNYHNGSNESGYLQYSNYTSNMKPARSLSVDVKDYIGNAGTIKCTITKKVSELEPNGYQTLIARNAGRIREPIADALAKKGYTINDLNMCIYKRVQEAGPYTRYGVTAAAFGLIDCSYKMTGKVLSYNHESGKVHSDPDGTNYCKSNSDICGKLGVNSKWGKEGGQCSANAVKCWHGLNCATFVRWAMCNGGMNLCTGGSAGAYSMASTKFFPEADGVTIYRGNVKYYSGNNLTNYSPEQLFRMLKPGDIIAQEDPFDSGGSTQHTYVVVGRDNDGYYSAEDGYYMRYYRYADLVKDQVLERRLLFLDKYYANPNNYNHLYG